MDTKAFKVLYFDTQRGERLIHSASDLEPVLKELQRNPIPESINIESPNGDILTIAIGSEFGFIQYTSSKPNIPYMIAIDKTKKGTKKEFREVDAGGTPTPIPSYACLPVNSIVEIVNYYLENLDIPHNIDWEDV